MNLSKTDGNASFWTSISSEQFKSLVFLEYPVTVLKDENNLQHITD